MGHVVTKDIYRKLGKKIDNLSMRVPYNDTFYRILKKLCSIEEADILIKMPYRLSKLDRVARITKCEKTKLRKILDSLCSKGLVMDIYIQGDYYYSLCPVSFGIQDFMMMRTREELNIRKLATLIQKYLYDDESFYAANFGDGQKVSFMRTLPYEEALNNKEYVEILDYEKATSLVKESNKFAIGICSCRHEKLHIGEKKCNVPLETCSAFGVGADYVIRHGFGKEVSKSEMLENIARSKELGLVLNIENVQKDITVMCHCCKCCCIMLSGINKYGYDNTLVTSTFIAEVDESKCSGCGRCSQVCPVDAIEMIPVENLTLKKKEIPKIDTSRCLGCGVCALKCPTEAIKLIKREQRVIHPETTYERLMLQCLERGTLQNQIFDNPQSITQKTMRAVVGGFLRLPPVKKALMSDMLRSKFLASLMRFKI